MKRILGLFVVLALPAAFLVSCGGDDSADSTTTTAKTSDSKSDSGSSSKDESTTTEKGSSSSGSAIDEFCDETKAIAEELKQAIADKDTDKLKELQNRASELSSKTSDLASEVLKDPSQASRLTKCASEVSDAAKG